MSLYKGGGEWQVPYFFGWFSWMILVRSFVEWYCLTRHGFHLMIWTKEAHCVKSFQIRSYFWSVFSYIRTEYRKIRTRNNSVFGHFSRSGSLKKKQAIEICERPILHVLQAVIILTRWRFTVIKSPFENSISHDCKSFNEFPPHKMNKLTNL